jgi:hypothetical protein
LKAATPEPGSIYVGAGKLFEPGNFAGVCRTQNGNKPAANCLETIKWATIEVARPELLVVENAPPAGRLKGAIALPGAACAR